MSARTKRAPYLRPPAPPPAPPPPRFPRRFFTPFFRVWAAAPAPTARLCRYFCRNLSLARAAWTSSSVDLRTSRRRRRSIRDAMLILRTLRLNMTPHPPQPASSSEDRWPSSVNSVADFSDFSGCVCVFFFGLSNGQTEELCVCVCCEGVRGGQVRETRKPARAGQLVRAKCRQTRASDKTPRVSAPTLRYKNYKHMKTEPKN